MSRVPFRLSVDLPIAPHIEEPERFCEFTGPQSVEDRALDRLAADIEASPSVGYGPGEKWPEIEAPKPITLPTDATTRAAVIAIDNLDRELDECLQTFSRCCDDLDGIQRRARKIRLSLMPKP